MLTGAILVYELYDRLPILQMAAKEYLTHWETLTDLSMYLLTLAGLVQYAVTRWQHSLLLRMACFFNIFIPLFRLFVLLCGFGFGRYGLNPQNIGFEVDMIKVYLRYLPAVVAMYWMLITLNRSHIVAPAAGAAGTAKGNGARGETPHIAGFHPVSKGMRLLIHVIDLGFVFLTFKLGLWAIQWLWPSYLTLSFTGLLLGFKWVLYGLLFLYYLLMETITGTSLGKIVTGTIIVDDAGEQAGFGSLLSRTFARLIPFDSLSFLFGKRGWHDSLSDTYVVRSKKHEAGGPVLQNGYPGS